ncbi:MAG TPA: alpha/beta hydrolase [Candidatus Binatia bacterium]|nr:alpha/beta hydrolase [Candidatus Binatia bacterium]
MPESSSVETWIQTSEGQKLFTRAWEAAPGSPAVGIVHGLGDHSGRWERVGRTLQASGFSACALDLPGHGRSDGKRGHVRSWDDYRLALTRWMEVLRKDDGGRRWALLGHSLGGLIALDWAVVNPGRVDALVLSAPPFELSLHPAAIKVHAARLVGLLWPGFTQSNGIPPSLLSHDPEVIRAHRADRLVHFRISARLFLELQRMRRTLSRAAGSSNLPTLLIQGGADPVTSPAGSALWAKTSRNGNVTYKEYPGLFHEVLNEPEGAAILEDVIVWLKQTMGQGPDSASKSATDSIHPR